MRQSRNHETSMRRSALLNISFASSTGAIHDLRDTLKNPRVMFALTAAFIYIGAAIGSVIIANSLALANVIFSNRYPPAAHDT